MALAPRSVCIDASLAGCDPHRFPSSPEMERNVLQALKVLPDRDIW